MTRIPVLDRDDMDANQQAVFDKVAKNNARTGFGPAIGYAYSAEVWRLHNESSAHLLDCSLTNAQVRIISLLTVRHWNAPYPWSAQAKTAIKAGLESDIVEAINAGEDPPFKNSKDTAVHTAARELLATGSLSPESFDAAAETLGYKTVVEIVATIGHFCTTAMMANVVGVEPTADAVSHLKRFTGNNS